MLPAVSVTDGVVDAGLLVVLPQEYGDGPVRRQVTDGEELLVVAVGVPLGNQVLGAVEAYGLEVEAEGEVLGVELPVHVIGVAAGDANEVVAAVQGHRLAEDAAAELRYAAGDAAVGAVSGGVGEVSVQGVIGHEVGVDVGSLSEHGTRVSAQKEDKEK